VGGLRKQNFRDSQAQKERACDGSYEESRIPQSTSLPAEPKRERGEREHHRY
jgi:hypothetical protein